MSGGNHITAQMPSATVARPLAGCRARGRVAVLLAGLAILTGGCIENSPLAGFSGAGSSASMSESAALLDGRLRVLGPTGYCIDTQTLRDSEGEAFALLAPCRARPNAPPAPALSIAVSNVEIAEGRAPAPEQIAMLVTTDVGLRTLSRSGNPDALEVPEMVERDGVLYLNILDLGGPATLNPEYWRAILPLGGRMVTLSALTPHGQAPERAQTLDLLAAFVSRLRAANGG
jgi:hypothetical protein